MPLALLVELVEVGDVEPLAGELRRQPPGLVVPEHPPSLAREDLGVGELARLGKLSQRRVGLRRPEEVTQAGRQLVVRDRAWRRPRHRLLGPIKERRRDQNPGECQAERLLVGDLLRPGPFVETKQLARLGPVKRRR